MRRWARTPLSAPMRRADDEGGQPDHGRAQRAFAAEALPIRMTMGPARSKDWWFISEIVPPRRGRGGLVAKGLRIVGGRARLVAQAARCRARQDVTIQRHIRPVSPARTSTAASSLASDLASQAAAAKKYLSALQRGRPGIAVLHPAQIRKIDTFTLEDDVCGLQHALRRLRQQDCHDLNPAVPLFT